ncbi:hypothetical protein F2P56_035380 [Juglans regia]|uniref:Uncharacterized protein n=1 Tax=Juglans regia TaxID=51240 RepID=A0A833SJ34_JUGRE|nr:hypothetical protein F2P56_035380 [Juglans regia]
MRISQLFVATVRCKAIILQNANGCRKKGGTSIQDGTKDGKRWVRKEKKETEAIRIEQGVSYLNKESGKSLLEISEKGKEKLIIQMQDQPLIIEEVEDETDMVNTIQNGESSSLAIRKEVLQSHTVINLNEDGVGARQNFSDDPMGVLVEMRPSDIMGDKMFHTHDRVEEVNEAGVQNGGPELPVPNIVHEDGDVMTADCVSDGTNSSDASAGVLGELRHSNINHARVHIMGDKTFHTDVLEQKGNKASGQHVMLVSSCVNEVGENHTLGNVIASNFLLNKENTLSDRLVERDVDTNGFINLQNEDQVLEFVISGDIIEKDDVQEICMGFDNDREDKLAHMCKEKIYASDNEKKSRNSEVVKMRRSNRSRSRPLKINL